MNRVEELRERIKELRGVLSALDSKLLLEEIGEEKYDELRQRYEAELKDVEAELLGEQAETQAKKIIFVAGLALIFLGVAVYVYSYTEIAQIEAHAVKASGAAGAEAEGYVFLKAANVFSLLAAVIGIVLTAVEALKYETRKFEYRKKWVVERGVDEAREVLVKALRRKGAKVSVSQQEIKARLKRGGGFLPGSRVKIMISLSGTAKTTEVHATLTAPKKGMERDWSSIRAHLDDLQP